MKYLRKNKSSVQTRESLERKLQTLLQMWKDNKEGVLLAYHNYSRLAHAFMPPGFKEHVEEILERETKPTKEDAEEWNNAVNAYLYENRKKLKFEKLNGKIWEEQERYVRRVLELSEIINKCSNTLRVQVTIQNIYNTSK